MSGAAEALPAAGLGAARRGRAGAGVAVLGFAALMAAAGAWAGGGEALHVLGAVPLGVLPAMLLLSLLNYAARGLRWLLFCRALGIAAPARPNLLIYVAGFALTATPGKLGEAVRIWLLRRHFGTPYERGAALLVADRLADGLATSVVVAATAGAVSGYRGAALGALAACAALVAVVLHPAWLGALVGLGYRVTGRLPRLFARARRAARALGRVRRPGVLAGALALGVIGWCAEGTALALLLRAMGQEVTLPAAIFAFCFAMLVGAVSFLPGGLGSTEATMIGLLRLLGLPLAPAVVATGIVRLTTLWFAILLGLIALPAAMRRHA